MNTSEFDLRNTNCISREFSENTIYKGYAGFVMVEGKLFCEVGYSSICMETVKYYDLEDFAGTNIARMCYTEKFGNSNNQCHAWSRYRIIALGKISKKIIASFYQVKSTGEYIYMIDNVAYSEHFPIEWALRPMETHDEDGAEYIYGPGTSRRHCGNCNVYGSWRGVFIGYCINCAGVYELARGNGLEDHGIDITQSAYLQGIDLTTVGYNIAPGEKYNCCLSGGRLPTGPDICHDQTDVDPVREDEIDKVVANVFPHSTWVSKRHPRRAYGISSNNYNEIIITEQTCELTPDLIRSKMEAFLRENDIEITDDNYSFPIGERPAWDCYRITKKPSWWFAWNAILRDPQKMYEEVYLHIRLYVSNVHTADKPAMLHLECNNVKGRNPVYWTMRHAMKSWILGETDTPLIVMPTDLYRDDNETVEIDGVLYPVPVPIY